VQFRFQKQVFLFLHGARARDHDIDVDEKILREQRRRWRVAAAALTR